MPDFQTLTPAAPVQPQRPCPICGGKKTKPHDRICRTCFKLLPEAVRTRIADSPDKETRNILFREAMAWLLQNRSEAAQ